MTSEKSKIKRLSNLLSNICEVKIKHIYKSTQQSFLQPQCNYIRDGRHTTRQPAPTQRSDLLWRNPEAEHGILVTTPSQLQQENQRVPWKLSFPFSVPFQHTSKPMTMQTAAMTRLSTPWGPSLLAGQSLGVQSQESSAAVLPHSLKCLCAQTTCIREHKSVVKVPLSGDLFLLAIC